LSYGRCWRLLAERSRGDSWRIIFADNSNGPEFSLWRSLVGLMTSLEISWVPAADAERRYEWNWAKQFVEEIQRMRQDAVLWVAVIANTFFWFLGAILLLNIVLYATYILQADEARSSYLLAALSLGIGMGSFLAGHVSGRKIEMGMILPGMSGIVLATGALFVPGLSYEMVMVLLVALGISAGFFVVPINALIQNRPKPEVKGRVIGAANLLSFGGIALQPGAIRDAATWPPGPGPRFPDLLCSLHWDGIGAGADASGVVAERAVLDEAATTG
jgi:Major Facilitator Superfamily